ncbi:MAG TPA: acyltransferase [Acidimicrobiales bacterium]|nr:acyltransferase [Acidimicrobiales bacterium]
MSATDWRRLPWEARYRWGGRVASAGRQLVVRATHRHCRVEFRGPVRLGPGFALDIAGPGTFVVGEAVDFRRGFVCEISGDGRVVIGDRCSFTSNVLIQCSTSIEVGDDCMFAQSVLLVDGAHRFRRHDVPVAAQGYDFRPIRIGHSVAVMAKSTVFADVGDHAMIGAHSVVSRPVPAYTLAVGAPARPVEYFGPGPAPAGVPTTAERRNTR